MLFKSDSAPTPGFKGARYGEDFDLSRLAQPKNISALLATKSFSDVGTLPTKQTKDVTLDRLISLEDYCTQRDAFRTLFASTIITICDLNKSHAPGQHRFDFTKTDSKTLQELLSKDLLSTFQDLSSAFSPLPNEPTLLVNTSKMNHSLAESRLDSHLKVFDKVDSVVQLLLNVYAPPQEHLIWGGPQPTTGEQNLILASRVASGPSTCAIHPVDISFGRNPSNKQVFLFTGKACKINVELARNYQGHWQLLNPNTETISNLAPVPSLISTFHAVFLNDIMDDLKKRYS